MHTNLNILVVLSTTWTLKNKAIKNSFSIFLPLEMITLMPQCLKIIEKVSFNIASEASYVYTLEKKNSKEFYKLDKISIYIWVDKC